MVTSPNIYHFSETFTSVTFAEMEVRFPVSREVRAADCWKGNEDCYYVMADWFHVAAMAGVLFLEG